MKQKIFTSFDAILNLFKFKLYYIFLNITIGNIFGLENLKIFLFEKIFAIVTVFKNRLLISIDIFVIIVTLLCAERPTAERCAYPASARNLKGNLNVFCF